jgi:transcriptional regulator with XRE-family HTH domain
METIGERIKLLRESTGLSQHAFAARTGWTQPYISQIESGKRQNISDGYLQTMQCLFGVDIEWLRTGKGEMRRGKREEAIGRIWLYTDDQMRKLLKFMGSIEEDAQIKERIKFKENLRRGQATGSGKTSVA